MSEKQSTILIVDDSALVRSMLKDYLDGEGFNVEEEEDGEAGLAHIITNPPDLIITDVQMPKLSGYELTRKVRANPKRAAIPIVMITTLSGTEDHIEGIEVGADDFINKPFNKQILLLKLRNLIKSYDLHRTVQQNLDKLQAQAGELKKAREEREFAYEMIGGEVRNTVDNLKLTLQTLQKELSEGGVTDKANQLLSHSSSNVEKLSEKLEKLLAS